MKLSIASIRRVIREELERRALNELQDQPNQFVKVLNMAKQLMAQGKNLMDVTYELEKIGIPPAMVDKVFDALNEAIERRKARMNERKKAEAKKAR